MSALERFDVACLRAPNPGPLTLSGTNTWIAGRDPAWVVDPGPMIEEHLQAVCEEVARRGGAGGVLATHDHADHAESLSELRDRLDAKGTDHGPLSALALPGHSDDHVVFLWRDAVCFSGDAILGEGSVFVQSRLGEYLDGLRALLAEPLELICPGHGPVVEDPHGVVRAYIAHRLDRERRLVAALEDGLTEEDELLDRVWDDVRPPLREAARITLRAHLEKLSAERR